MPPEIWIYLEPVLAFSAYVLLGSILRKTKIMKGADSKVLNTAIIYVTLPAFIFSAVYNSDFSLDALRAVGLGWIIFPIMIVLAYLLCRLMHLDRRMTGTVMLCIAFANTGFFGYPLTSAIFGDSHMVESVFYDLFVSVVSLFTVGIIVASRFGTPDGEKTNPLLELVRIPTFWALLAALVCRQFTLPQAIASWISTLGGVTSPLIMISIGLSMDPSRLKGNGLLASGILLAKLIVAPLLAFFLAGMVMEDPVSSQVLVLEAGCPVMMLCVVIAQRFDLDQGFVAAMAFVSVLVSAVTIPLLQTLLF